MSFKVLLQRRFVWICAALLLGCASAVSRAATAAKPAPAIGPGALLLPETIYAAPGQETNIYFDNVVLEPFVHQYLFDVTCAKGNQQEERWTWAPNAAGEFPLQIEVRDLQDNIVTQGNTTLRVSPANAGAGQKISLLCIGDSLTHASIYTAELLHLFSGENNPSLTLLGTNHVANTAPENLHEGYGGWKYSSFLTRWTNTPPPAGRPQAGSSPFVFLENGKPVFDFPRYVKEKLHGTQPDFITVMLGTNDIFSATDATVDDSIQEILANADQLIAGVRAGAPHAKIAILPPVPPTYWQDAFGNNYHSGQTRWGYRKNQFKLDWHLMQHFGNREKEGLFIVPAYANIDCMHNFPSTESAVNARNSTKVQRATNGVHPAAPGYQQIADSIYGWIKWELSK